MLPAAEPLPRQTPLSLKQVGYWQAQLSLNYVRKHDKTVLQDRQHHGPLTVQRSFYPEGEDVCHTYLVHPPGGMVGGDHININIQLQADTHALLTTPAAGKVYHSLGAESLQYQHLHLHENATLEWFPQEMIVFNGSRTRLHTDVHLAQGASFIGWDMLCLGRPASQDYFEQGHCVQNLQLYREGKPVLIDRFIASEQHNNRQSCWGMAGHLMLATFIATGVTKTMLERLQDPVNGFSEGMAGITLIDDIVVCRCLVNQARHAKDLFTELWCVLRPLLLQKDMHEPRIWLT